MAEQSAIEWTDATVNWWWGCTKVGPGCDHCYAETLNKLRGSGEWGVGAARRKIKGAPALLAKLERQAPEFLAEHGRRRRVFMHSMSDVFDNEVDRSWRFELFRAIEDAPHLEVQIVTKRVSNVTKMVPGPWKIGGWPKHVGLMITVVNQEEADRDIPRLMELKERFHVPWIGLSIEPMQGPIDLERVLFKRGLYESGAHHYVDVLRGGFWSPWGPGYRPSQDGEEKNHFTNHSDIKDQLIDWVIVGGESGSKARPMHPDWVRQLRDQCVAAGVAFFMKQWGEWMPDKPFDNLTTRGIMITSAGSVMTKEDMAVLMSGKMPNGDFQHLSAVGKKRSGAVLDGREWKQFPEQLAAAVAFSSDGGE